MRMVVPRSLPPLVANGIVRSWGQNAWVVSNQKVGGQQSGLTDFLCAFNRFRGQSHEEVRDVNKLTNVKRVWNTGNAEL